MAASSQQPMRYMFVDCPNPQKAKLQRSSKGSKSHVRAHVTREFHRRLRVERLQAFTKQQQPSFPPLLTPPAEEIVDVIKRDEEADLLDVAEIVTPVSVITTSSGAEDECESATILRDIGNKFIWSMLSQSRSDPFNCLPIQDLPKYMQRVLDHGELKQGKSPDDFNNRLKNFALMLW